MNIVNMTATEIAAEIKNGKITAIDAVKAFCENIEKNENKINAFITTNKEKAIKKAEEVQIKINKGELSGPQVYPLPLKITSALKI